MFYCKKHIVSICFHVSCVSSPTKQNHWHLRCLIWKEMPGIVEEDCHVPEGTELATWMKGVPPVHIHFRLGCSIIHMLHGADLFSFIYLQNWVILFGQILVNIPAPWSIWIIKPSILVCPHFWKSPSLKEVDGKQFFGSYQPNWRLLGKEDWLTLTVDSIKGDLTYVCQRCNCTKHDDTCEIMSVCLMGHSQLKQMIRMFPFSDGHVVPIFRQM